MHLQITTIALAATLAFAGPNAQSQESSVPSSPAQVSGSVPNQIPAGQEFDVRLQTMLDSETAEAEDRFEATTVADLMQDGRVLVPAGTVVRGIVRSVDRASRTDRTGELTLSFDEMVIDGESYDIRANAVDPVESEGLKGEAARIGAGAGVGAIVGGILGGVKGAITGVLIGAGGTIVATEGKDVELPAGTILRIRMDTPITVER